MESKDFINKIVEVIIDRPIGSKHPEYDSIYPLNYGYIPNTVSGDGEELDCFILGINEKMEKYTGKCIAVIHRLDDNEDKLVIAPEGKEYTTSDIRALTDFQEQYFKSIIIRDDDYLEFSKNIPELSVTDIKKSLQFYKTIGFKVEYERSENKFAFISLDGIQFMLQESTSDDKWNVGPLTYPFGNGINFQLEVENVDEIYDRLKKSGYRIVFDMEENWYRQGNKLLGNKEFLVQDPDGYLLRFSEDLGEKAISENK